MLLAVSTFSKMTVANFLRILINIATLSFSGRLLKVVDKTIGKHQPKNNNWEFIDGIQESMK